MFLMIIAIFILFFPMYLIGRWVYHWAEKKGLATIWRVLLGFLGAATVWNIVFYKTMPTNIKVQYLCTTQAKDRLFSTAQNVKVVTILPSYYSRNVNDDMVKMLLESYHLIVKSVEAYDEIQVEGNDTSAAIKYYGAHFLKLHKIHIAPFYKEELLVPTQSQNLCVANKIQCSQAEINDRCKKDEYHSSCQDGIRTTENGDKIKIECSLTDNPCVATSEISDEYGRYLIKYTTTGITDRLQEIHYQIYDTVQKKMLGEKIWFATVNNHTSAQDFDGYGAVEDILTFGSCEPSSQNLMDFTKKTLLTKTE